MTILPHIASLQATAGLYGRPRDMGAIHQDQMALMNKARPDMSPAETASLAQQDKALALEGIQAKTNYLIDQARLEGAQNLRKKNREQRELLIGNGSLG